MASTDSLSTKKFRSHYCTAIRSPFSRLIIYIATTGYLLNLLQSSKQQFEYTTGRYRVILPARL